MKINKLSTFLIMCFLFGISFYSSPSYFVPVQSSLNDTIPIVSGTFNLNPAINYQCAFFLGEYLIDLYYSQFTFADDGTTLTVSPAISGGCFMTGLSATNGHIDVSCTYFGNCDETYSLEGDFTDNNTWVATFSAEFSGMCLDCTNQQFSITGTRDPPISENSGNQFLHVLFLCSGIIILIALIYTRKKLV